MAPRRRWLDAATRRRWLDAATRRRWLDAATRPRVAVVAPTTVCLLVTLLAYVGVLPGDWGRHYAIGGTAPPVSTSRDVRDAWPEPAADATMSGTFGPGSPDPSSTPTGTPVAGLPGGPFLATGSLRDSRVLVTGLADVTGVKGDETRYRQLLATAVVGAPWTMVALPGRQLALTATNQAELVLLTDGLTTVRTLDLRSVLGIPKGTIVGYGSLDARDGTVYGAAAWGNDVAAFAVDVASWTVTASRRVPDMAQFPHTCLTGDGRLAVLTTRRLTLLRVPSLDPAASTEVEGAPVGLACAGDEVVVSDDIAPQLSRYDARARRTGTITYRGRGSGYLHHSAGVVYVADEVSRTVVRCALTATGCTVSRPLGGHPTSLLHAGGVLLAGMQVRERIAVLDPVTLAVRGTLPFPGMPRAFALIR